MGRFLGQNHTEEETRAVEMLKRKTVLLSNAGSFMNGCAKLLQGLNVKFLLLNAFIRTGKNNAGK